MLLLESRATGRIFSFGGGIQSMAVLVLAAQGKLRYDAFVFANVADDSENPATLRYFEDVSKPYADKHGIPLITVQKTYKGKPDTLLSSINRDNRQVPIPAYMSGGAPGRRTCTQEFKIAVVDKWVKQQRYKRCVIGIGISWDEFERAKDEQWHDRYGKKKIGFWKRREHPLLDLRLTRADCQKIILEAGLPLPPKSSCYFCPFHKMHEWIAMRRDEPELFMKSVEIQQQVNRIRLKIGKDTVYMTSRLIPLENIGVQPRLFDDEPDACVEGVCMT